MNKTVLHLYNSKSGQKEAFSPMHADKITLYACGPTVYNYAHIGNLRTFLAEDLLIRTLRYCEYSVFAIMNFTDVDDKTLKKSQMENKPIGEITKFYEDAFLKDIDELRISRANHYPRATEFISQMIDCIVTLIDKGYAYESEGSVYYDISKFSQYGELSHIHPEDLEAGASERVRSDEYDKHHVADFVLWKARVPQDGTVFWKSPWGEGRPGWHIECSAMSYAYLGNTFDIHCGGIDNKFPHHENEIAQSIVAYGGEFARVFFHVKHLKLADQKMSKSLGNIVYLQTLIESGWGADVIRYALLSAHYRQELVFSNTILAQSQEALARIRRFLRDIENVQNSEQGSGDVSRETKDILDQLKQEFVDALSDDLNFSKAMGAIFSSIKKFYKTNWESIKVQDGQKILQVFLDLDKVCGFLFPWGENDAGLDPEVQELLKSREQARASRDYKEADRIRDELFAKGWEVLDSAEGTTANRRKSS